MKKILRLYTPHDIQRKFHESKARYRVLAAGRQLGKSSACLNELLKKAWETPETTYWFISPTYDQAKIQYRKLNSMLFNCQNIFIKNNQSELRVKLINNSEIAFKSAEVSQNLRGATLNGVVLDEVREMTPDIWTMIIQPMLATTNGWAVFASTPAGYDGFYDIAQKAMDDTTGNWEFFKGPSTCNPLFSIEEFERLKKEMSEPVFAQEILAEFRDITAGKAYLSYSKDNERLTSPFTFDGSLISPHLPIVVGMDFNVSPMAWTLGQVRGIDSYWFDEIRINNTNTQAQSIELVERVRNHKPGVILIGDATGKARHTSSSQSDFAIVCNALSNANIRWENRTPESNPPVKERVNIVNTRLKAADGSIHMWIHPVNCPYLKKDFERVVWKTGAVTQLDQTRDPTLTHQSDSVGYPLCVLTPINIHGAVGTMRIIMR